MRKLLVAILVYSSLALALTWPALSQLGRAVPGAARTDIWNSLWTLWFGADALLAGHLPYAADLLNHPDGGTLLVSDPLGVLFVTPLLLGVSLPTSYALLVFWRLLLAGLSAHLLARDLIQGAAPGDDRAAMGAWISGVGLASAPVILSAVHNGTSESFNVGWALLSVWAAHRVATGGGARWVLLTGVLLPLACLASWYAGVVAFFFVGALLLLGAGDRPWKAGLSGRFGALILGLLLTAPLARAFQTAATAPTNLVGIKHSQELDSVRRSTGPADPVGYLRGGDFRSPDFRVISRYGEGFFHCHYLGWVLMVGALLSLRRRQGTGFVWLAGALGLALSLGPVLVSQASPVILAGDRAVPLPYFLVERLPGFSSLSLVYRLALAPALAAALLAGVGYGSLLSQRRAPRWAAAVVVAAILLGCACCRPSAASPTR